MAKYSKRLNNETMRLLGATHTAQRNADHLFSNDVGAHFANRFQGSHIAFIGDGDDAGGGDNGNGDGDNSDNGSNNGNNGAVDVNSPEFKAALAAALKAQKDEDEKNRSLAEQRKAQKDADDQKKRERAQLIGSATDAAKFDSGFDQFISTNAAYFPDNITTLRKSVESQNIEDPTEASSLLAATAAKEFFSVKANLDVLDRTDRATVEKTITGKRFENEIDGLKAWKMVEKAMFGHGLQKQHTSSRGTASGKTGESTGYKQLDNWLGGFYPEHMKDLTDNY